MMDWVKEPVDFINYLGSGVLIAAIKKPYQPGDDFGSSPMYIVMVYEDSKVHPWCVSEYADGSLSRESGSYFEHFDNAIDELAVRTQGLNTRMSKE